MDFFTYFQFSVRYETDTYFITSLKKDTATHISDYIHEWRRRCFLIKFEIADQFLSEWFTKSFVAPTARDIDMGGFITEEKAIGRAKYLDLVYS